jgi:hypothetical protein
MCVHLLFRAASTIIKINRGCIGENNGIKGSNIMAGSLVALPFLFDQIHQHVVFLTYDE